jgi:hypothetical protein
MPGIYQTMPWAEKSIYFTLPQEEYTGRDTYIKLYRYVILWGTVN